MGSEKVHAGHQRRLWESCVDDLGREDVDVDRGHLGYGLEELGHSTVPHTCTVVSMDTEVHGHVVVLQGGGLPRRHAQVRWRVPRRELDRLVRRRRRGHTRRVPSGSRSC